MTRISHLCETVLLHFTLEQLQKRH